MSIEERLPPNYGKLDVALRSIGYSFEVAVADVIDNSIDAQAKNVLVRLINTGDGHLDLARRRHLDKLNRLLSQAVEFARG